MPIIPSIPYTLTPDFPRLVGQAVAALRVAQKNVVTKTANYTTQTGDNVIRGDATAGAITILLPPAAQYTGMFFDIKKIDASVNAVIIDGNGAETIDGAATVSLGAQYESRAVVSNGVGWDSIASASPQDKARLDASFTRYHSLLDCSSSHTAGRVAGTYGMAQGQPLAITGVGTLYALNTIYIAAADYPVAGTLNPKLRIRVSLYVNDVAPTGNFTIGLHPVTRPATSGGAGLNIFTIGAAVTSSTVTITAPAADSSSVAVTAADFALPADGHYVIGVVTTATVAVSSHLHISALLQMRYA